MFGDSVLRTIQRTISGVLFNQTAAQVTADTAGYGTLRLVGIETNPDGTLKINDTVMSAKMDGDLDAFTDLFVDTDGFNNGGAALGDTGLLHRLDRRHRHGRRPRARARSSDQGLQLWRGPHLRRIVRRARQSLNANIKSLSTQIDRGETHSSRPTEPSSRRASPRSNC